MKTLGNIIWLVFGGILVFIEYLVSSLLLCVTIIGIPFGLQTLKLALLGIFSKYNKISQLIYTQCIAN